MQAPPPSIGQSMPLRYTKTKPFYCLYYMDMSITHKVMHGEIISYVKWLRVILLLVRSDRKAYVTDIDSVCMQYRKLWLWDIVDQTPRHWLISCCWSNTKTPAQIMLPCAVCHTVVARHRTKRIKPSVETLSHTSADVPAPRWLRHRWGWRRKRGRGQQGWVGVTVGEPWIFAPLLHPVRVSIFFDLELRFEF